MKLPFFLLALPLTLLASAACALTVSGTVAVSGAVVGSGAAMGSGGLPAGTRVGAFALSSGGTPQDELVSVPVQGGRFTLNLQDAPPARAQAVLRPETVIWPGVLEPVSVSGQASVADVRLYLYTDSNGSGRRDDNEPLLEGTPTVGPAFLLLEWSSAQARVTAARGFDSTLSAGWNALLVNVGRAVKVTTQGGGSVNVVLNVQR